MKHMDKKGTGNTIPVVKSEYLSRYEVASALLSKKKGTLIDLGSRDRRLLEFLDTGGASPSLTYYSADIEHGHDYAVDLERPLPFKDGQFDYVVILDVLEHLEHIHQAFDECARIARKELIVSLPNMSTLIHRVHFLLRGSLKTGKYDLYGDHQGDRHRWLTTYKNAVSFVSARSQENKARVSRIIGCRDFYSFSPIGVVNTLYTRLGQIFMGPSLYCNTLVFDIITHEPSSD
ncbi:MAG: class I SAM-dependent methyltransferase [bacterium]